MLLPRTLKTIGKTAVILLFTFFTVGYLISVFYEKEIKQMVISELNKQLDTKITVEEFDLTIFRHFPFASIEMKNVVVDEVSSANIKDTLLSAHRLSLLFNLADVFNKDVTLKKILITEGKINIKVDKEGYGNYHFWKKSEDDSGSGTIELKKIGLKKVQITYTDLKAEQDYSLLANNAELYGKFSGTEFSLKTRADLFVYRFFIHNINYADHKPVRITSGLVVNNDAGIFKLDDSHVRIADINFNVAGGIYHDKKSWLLDLAVKSEEASVSSFISVLPPMYTEYFKEYKSRGKFLFSSTIKGNIEDEKIPLININYSVKDGSISSGLAQIEKLNFSGTFNNKKSANRYTLDIPQLTASLSGHEIKASLRLDNLPDAYLTLRARTQLNLREIQPFLRADTLESLSGDMAMNISYAGKIKELSNISRGKHYKVSASGKIDLSNVNFKLKRNPLEFKNMSGNFSLHNNDIYIKNFTGNISSSDFRLEGVFRNFVSFLLIPDQPGEVQANVTSSAVNMDELLVNKSESNSGDTSYILKFNPRLLCELNVNIDKLHFRRFSATNISGHVNLNKQVISGRDLRFNAMAGNVVMDATINASRRDSIFMTYDTKFNKVDITRLFYEMENFDQSTMTDKNVKGRVSADVQFSSAWAVDLTLNSKSVRSTCSLIVENGELVNFSPIQALAKYIHVPDLNHIRFSTMKNNISITNRKIFIPNMDINSSAINISGNGTHDFDNIVDYHLQLLLSDVVGRKAQVNSSEFGEIEDDGLGRTKLFISMRGPVDDPKFGYDRKAAGEKIKKDIALEKQNLKGLLKKEFGLYKSEPSVQVEKPKKKQEMQIDWSEE